MFHSATSVATEFFPGSLKQTEQKGNRVTIFSSNNLVLRVDVLSDTIIRLRYATEGRFGDDFSYAINKKFIPQEINFTLEDDPKSISIITGKLRVEIKKENLKVSFKNLKGKVINEDEKGFHWEENKTHGGNIVLMSKAVKEGEHFYGLGDKPVQFNLRGKRLQNWGTDEYGFSKGRDPLYKNIPFYTGLHQGIGYGMFFDNSFRSYFDFASERRAVTSFWANGGEMNYYFIYGPELISVVEQYGQLTGTPELPPLWALGYHQCKWSYYPESNVKEIARKFREHKIPCDAIYLDIDYMDGFRCFTWDKEKFPDPKRMVSELKEQGFKTVVIIDPGIKIDENYSVFKEAIENNYFCRRADGPYMKGKVWPGDCYFPDFTNPKVRKWWAGLYQELVEDIGVKGVWNDMNEPAVFEVPTKTFPDDVRHDYDGHPCSHRKAHNIYGMQMARATYKGVKKFLDNERPFIITRSAYSGAQRHTSAWTGDNIATWEHLLVANLQCQRLAVSGFSFVGSDIGGFTEHPTPELYIRWIQLGVFHVFCRTHSSGDHGEQEPWTFGETALNISRKYIELRYQLLPYLYTAFYQHVKYGTPILRPISFAHQDDKDTLYRSDEFYHGDNILICPILEAGAQGRYLYLPKGDWYNYWSDEALKGGKEIYIAAPLDIIPLIVKAGSVIPMYPVQQYVGEKKIDVLSLHVYYIKGEESSVLYEDEGNGYGYKEGNYNLKKFIVKGAEKSLELEQINQGHFDQEYNQYEIIMHGLPFKPTSITLNGKLLDNKEVVEKENKLSILVNEQFLKLSIAG